MMCDDCIYSKDDVCINENAMFSYDGDCLSKLDKEAYAKIYNKAIDDFKSMLEERILAGKMIDEKFAYIDNCDIDEIAEQLKAGGENEY